MSKIKDLTDNYTVAAFWWRRKDASPKSPSPLIGMQEALGMAIRADNLIERIHKTLDTTHPLYDEITTYLKETLRI